MQKHNSKYNFNILGGNADEKQGITDHVQINSLCVPFNFTFCDLLISCGFEDHHRNTYF